MDFNPPSQKRKELNSKIFFWYFFQFDHWKTIYKLLAVILANTYMYSKKINSFKKCLCEKDFLYLNSAVDFTDHYFHQKNVNLQSCCCKLLRQFFKALTAFFSFITWRYKFRLYESRTFIRSYWKTWCNKKAHKFGKEWYL